MSSLIQITGITQSSKPLKHICIVVFWRDDLRNSVADGSLSQGCVHRDFSFLLSFLLLLFYFFS
jgi:hypothetical protein